MLLGFAIIGLCFYFSVYFNIEPYNKLRKFVISCKIWTKSIVVHRSKKLKYNLENNFSITKAGSYYLHRYSWHLSILYSFIIPNNLQPTTCIIACIQNQFHISQILHNQTDFTLLIAIQQNTMNQCGVSYIKSY